MTAPKNNFTIPKVIGVLTVATFIITAFNWASDIKTDIALIKQKIYYANDKLEYRISELENKQKQSKEVIFNQPKAILPNAINLENYVE
jgi:hypothetical protein